MVRLGVLRRKKKISFKEFIKEFKKEGAYRITTIFPPNKYPSFTVIFETEEEEVKLSIKKDIFKKALNAMGITLGKRNLPSLVVVIDRDFYGLDVDEDLTYQLEWRGTYWRLKKEEKEDIPF